MPTLNFPSSPALNDSYAFGGKTWVYNGSAWALQSTTLTTTAVTEGTNLYFTNARSRAAISVSGSGSYDNSTGVITITGGVSSVGGATGAVSNAQLASGITSSGVLTTGNVAEGANLYFTTSRARASIDAAANGGITYSSATGNVSLSASGVTANTYGGAAKVPVFTVDTYGRITSAANVSVAGVSGFAASGNTFTISTADGNTFSANIQLDSVRLGTDTTGAYVGNLVAGTGITITGLGNEGTTPTITNAGVTSVNGSTGAITSIATTTGNLSQFAATTSAELAGVISDETGSGALVFATSPTLVTPALGTPASGVMTNVTGLPISTGVSGLGTGVATFLATPSSSNFASAITDETGSGSLVFATSPVLLTPNIGTPSYAVLTNATGLPISTGVSGLGAGVATFLATPSSANLASAVTDETGTGNILFSNSPVMVTPNLGTPSAVTLTNATGLPVGTGISGLGTGVATFLGQEPTSANLRTLITDETGTGALVFGTSPAITTSLTTPSASFDLVNTGATTVNFAGAGTTVNIGAATGNTNILNNMVISGNLVVQGNITTVSSTTLNVADKNITIAKGAADSATADGAGITVDGANATLNYVHATTAWTSSQDVDLATGKVYKVNNGQVLSATGLGPNVVNSNLTSVGTISSGTWQGSSISTTYTAAKVTAVNGRTGAVTGLAETANGLSQFASTTSAELATLISDETGTGTVVFSTSPVLVTPNIGTPSYAVLTNATGLPVSSGVSGLGANVATFLATPTSANFAFAVTDETGSGNVVLSNNPVLVTPNIGTPSAGVLTNATGLPISTGVSGLGTNVATFLATPSSSNLASAVTDETGSGALVFATSPTLVTPALGTPSSATLTNATGLPISTGVSGLGAAVATFLATPSSSNLASAVTDETGSGALVFATSPTLVTPALGTPSSATLTNATGLPIGTGVSGLGANQTTLLAANAHSGVTATTYGSTLNIPVINVDVYGRITSASNVAITSGVSSVGGATGAVSNAQLASAITSSGILTTSNVSEVTNLYFTNARSRASISLASGNIYGKGTYTVATGELQITAANVSISATAPASPNVGDTWIDDATGSSYLFYYDGSSFQWVEQAAGTVISSLVESVAGSTGAISNAMIASGVITSQGSTGSGSIVLATSPTLVTPALGTPSSGTLTNATGLPLTTGVTGTLPVANGGTGIASLGSGVATFLGTPSSANLASAITDETGSGALVFATSPTLVTPALGTPASGVMTNVTGLPISTGVSGLGTGVATFLATPSSANLASAITDETGSGVLVFGTSPAITTSLTTPSASFDLINTTATTVNFAKAATALSIGAATGTTTVNNNMTVTGNLTVSGTTTTVSSATLEVTDKNITVAKGAADSSAADGAGITVDGASATFNYVHATTAWTSSQDLNLLTGKVHKINGTQVLSGSGLGSGILASNLTSVGTITSGTWNGTAIAGQYGGTGVDNTGKTITLGGNFTTSGAFATTLTSTAATNVTLPTTGTLATLAGSETFTNKTLTSPTLTAPALGTPASGVMTSVTGLPLTTGVTGTLPVANGGTGVTASTGTTNVVLSNSPTLVTPNLGTPSAVVLTSGTGLPLTTGVTGILPVANGGTNNASGYASGGAASASTATVVDDTSTNATYYPMLGQASSGNTAPKVSSTKLTFNPSTGLLTSTDYNSSSDKRLKKNIKTVSGALDAVNALRGVSFEWKEGGAKSIGLIAQEVQEILPEIISADDNGYLGIKYTNVIGVLVEAIKELKADFEAYKKTHP